MRLSQIKKKSPNSESIHKLSEKTTNLREKKKRGKRSMMVNKQLTVGLRREKNYHWVFFCYLEFICGDVEGPFAKTYFFHLLKMRLFEKLALTKKK